MINYRLAVLVFIAIISGCKKQPETIQVDPSDEATYLIAEAHKPVWQSSINQVLELADIMPEDQYDFSPHDSLRSFSEQLIHMSHASHVIANLYMKDTPPSEEPDEKNLSQASKEEIRNYVKSELEATGEILASVTDSEMMDTINTISGKRMTRLEGLINVHDHLANHKARASLYLTLSGNKPPEYRYY